MRFTYLPIFLFLLSAALGVQAAAPSIMLLKRQLDAPGAFPKWVPEGSKVALSEALQSIDDSDADSSENQEYKNTIGIFGRFYLQNQDAFSGVCEEAQSLSLCKALVWNRAQSLLATKIHQASSDAVNELLFLKDNKHLPEMSIPLETVLSSLGFDRGQSLSEFLDTRTEELNPGGFKTSLFNHHEAYSQASGLLGSISPKEMSALLLGLGDAQKIFQRKFDRARSFFEIEWRLFASGVLLPHVMFEAIVNARRAAQSLSKESAKSQAAIVGLAVCEQAPESLRHAPELFPFCNFIHQNF